jgi:hypothetical protein
VRRHVNLSVFEANCRSDIIRRKDGRPWEDLWGISGVPGK